MKPGWPWTPEPRFKVWPWTTISELRKMVARQDALIDQQIRELVALMRHTCPVCSGPLEREPESFDICPTCMTEFGYDDHVTPHDVLRRRWLKGLTDVRPLPDG